MNFRESMQRLRAEFDAGEKSALAFAMYGCARLRKPLPQWVAEAWIEGWVRASMRVADWNDVLGVVKKIKKTHQRRNEQAIKIAKALPKFRGVAIERDHEAGLFSELAKETGVGSRQVKAIYYDKTMLLPLVRGRTRPKRKSP